MKRKIFNILMCGIVVVSIAGCGKKNESTPIKDVNDVDKKPSQESNDIYSKCAKSGNTCTKEDIIAGQLVKVELNDKETAEFYVLSDDGSELTLIMNGNYDINTPWISSEDIKGVCSEEDGKSCGPYTAMKTLNEATKGWTKIDDIKNYVYEVNEENATPHYKSLKISEGVTTITGNSNKEYKVEGNTKARLATVEELSEVNSTDWIRKKISELYDNKQVKHFYVLTLTPSYGGYDGTVKTLTCKYNTRFTNINVDNELTVMPVITISKSKA